MKFVSRSIAADGADRVFTSREVSRIAKTSLRQLQWWDERKLISPRQEGHKRLYHPEQLIEIMVVAELRRKGLTLQKIRWVMRFWRGLCRISPSVARDPPRPDYRLPVEGSGGSAGDAFVRGIEAYGQG